MIDTHYELGRNRKLYLIYSHLHGPIDLFPGISNLLAEHVVVVVGFVQFEFVGFELVHELC